MPLYEYECRKCGEKFELRRNISDRDDEIKCPKCESENPRRILSKFSTGSIPQSSNSDNCG